MGDGVVLEGAVLWTKDCWCAWELSCFYEVMVDG
jgi:hypothetical protein